MNNQDVIAETVYSRLADEESRNVFKWRYEHYKTGDDSTFFYRLLGTGAGSINSYIKLRQDADKSRQPDVPVFPDAFDFARNKSAQRNGVILYGAGYMLQHYVRYMNILGVEIRAVCDTYKQGEMFGEYPIVSVDEALAHRGGAAILITTVKKAYQQEIRQSLLTLGVAEDSVFVAVDVDISSRAFYLREYFPCDLMKPVPEEIYIDAGCLDGKTILAFREFSGNTGYKRIYGFEPQQEAFAQTLKTMQGNGVENAVIHCKGLWNTAETLCFHADNRTGGAKIATDGEVKIETVRLDDIVAPGDKVTLIKMDIEGAELNALRGASKIIQRDKPRLSICVYHKPEDILEIPSYILSLNQEYKLYFRHHTPMHEWETVLYAV